MSGSNTEYIVVGIATYLLTALILLAFKTALNVAVDAAWQELPSTEAEQIETVVTNMDRIALAYGYPLGWLDVGLERVTS